MKRQIRIKAQDESGTIEELTVMKWGWKYYTTDTQIQIIADKAKKRSEEHAGDPGMFGRRRGIQMAVVFSKRMRVERLPEEIDKFAPRSPTKLILKFVKYNTSGNTIFINYFSEVSK